MINYKDMDKTKDSETAWTPQEPKLVKPLRPLTTKQRLFVQELINNPKQSATEAVKKVYKVKDSESSTARTMASENLAKPNIKLELAKYQNNAELAIIEVLEQSKKKMYEDSKEAVQWAVNTRQTADSILDRVLGKATQRVESTSTAVTLNIDLTGVAQNKSEDK